MWSAFIVGLTVFNAMASLPASVLNEDIFETSRIIGGTEIDIKTAPYQVWIPKYGCGGSILSKDYILTAAHCVDNGKIFKIRAGSSKRSSGGVLVKGKAVKHPKYTDEGYDYDVALLKLEKPLEMSDSIKIIKMADKKYEVPAGDLVVLTGWGVNNANSSNDVEILQLVEVHVVSYEDCKKAYPKQMTSNMICAAAEGKDACRGDSGGPLVHKDIQVGVVSYGEGCALKGYPGVYAGVAAFRDWIDENMK